MGRDVKPQGEQHMQSRWMLGNASGQVVTAHTRGISPVNSLHGTASIQHWISDQPYGYIAWASLEGFVN